MTSSVNIMQDRITRTRLTIDPPEVLLRPRMDDFQLMDFHRAREAIDAGRACVEAAAPQLRSLAARRPGGQPGGAVREPSDPEPAGLP